MALAGHSQENFIYGIRHTGPELSKAYFQSVSDLQNYFVTSGGHLVRRPGTNVVQSFSEPSKVLRMAPIGTRPNIGFIYKTEDGVVKFLPRNSDIPFEVPLVDFHQLSYGKEGQGFVEDTKQSLRLNNISNHFTSITKFTREAIDFSVSGSKVIVIGTKRSRFVLEYDGVHLRVTPTYMASDEDAKDYVRSLFFKTEYNELPNPFYVPNGDKFKPYNNKINLVIGADSDIRTGEAIAWLDFRDQKDTSLEVDPREVGLQKFIGKALAFNVIPTDIPLLNPAVDYSARGAYAHSKPLKNLNDKFNIDAYNADTRDKVRIISNLLFQRKYLIVPYEYVNLIEDDSKQSVSNVYSDTQVIVPSSNTAVVTPQLLAGLKYKESTDGRVEVKKPEEAFSLERDTSIFPSNPAPLILPESRSIHPITLEVLNCGVFPIVSTLSYTVPSAIVANEDITVGVAIYPTSEIINPILLEDFYGYHYLRDRIAIVWEAFLSCRGREQASFSARIGGPRFISSEINLEMTFNLNNYYISNFPSLWRDTRLSGELRLKGIDVHRTDFGDSGISSLSFQPIERYKRYTNRWRPSIFYNREVARKKAPNWEYLVFGGSRIKIHLPRSYNSNDFSVYYNRDNDFNFEDNENGLLKMFRGFWYSLGRDVLSSGSIYRRNLEFNILRRDGSYVFETGVHKTDTSYINNSGGLKSFTDYTQEGTGDKARSGFEEINLNYGFNLNENIIAQFHSSTPAFSYVTNLKQDGEISINPEGLIIAVGAEVLDNIYTSALEWTPYVVLNKNSLLSQNTPSELINSGSGLVLRIKQGNLTKTYLLSKKVIVPSVGVKFILPTPIASGAFVKQKGGLDLPSSVDSLSNAVLVLGGKTKDGVELKGFLKFSFVAGYQELVTIDQVDFLFTTGYGSLISSNEGIQKITEVRILSDRVHFFVGNADAGFFDDFNKIIINGNEYDFSQETDEPSIFENHARVVYPVDSNGDPISPADIDVGGGYTLADVPNDHQVLFNFKKADGSLLVEPEESQSVDPEEFSGIDFSSPYSISIGYTNSFGANDESSWNLINFSEASTLPSGAKVYAKCAIIDIGVPSMYDQDNKILIGGNDYDGGNSVASNVVLTEDEEFVSVSSTGEGSAYASKNKVFLQYSSELGSSNNIHGLLNYELSPDHRKVSESGSYKLDGAIRISSTIAFLRSKQPIWYDFEAQESFPITEQFINGEYFKYVLPYVFQVLQNEGEVEIQRIYSLYDRNVVICQTNLGIYELNFQRTNAEFRSEDYIKGSIIPFIAKIVFVTEDDLIAESKLSFERAGYKNIYFGREQKPILKDINSIAYSIRDHRYMLSKLDGSVVSAQEIEGQIVGWAKQVFGDSEFGFSTEQVFTSNSEFYLVGDLIQNGESLLSKNIIKIEREDAYDLVVNDQPVAKAFTSIVKSHPLATAPGVEAVGRVYKSKIENVKISVEDIEKIDVGVEGKQTEPVWFNTELTEGSLTKFLEVTNLVSSTNDYDTRLILRQNDPSGKGIIFGFQMSGEIAGP